LRPLGSDAHEMLDIVPVRWRAVRNVRPKYSCRSCEKIVQAPVPVSAIARGKATFATLAHVVVSKFNHHPPLYRQAEMMAAQGLDIDRSTLAGWTGQAAVLLDPIVSRMRDEVLKADKIHAEPAPAKAGDTPAPVLDPGRGKTATGRLWVYAVDDQASGSTAPRATWYRFTPDRTAAHPMAHLAGFRGFLQADAYAGYDGLYRGGATEVACWAHFRRKVFDLHERSSTPLTTDILGRIGALYAVEAEVRGQPPDVRCRSRQEKSRPLVDALREVLNAALRRLSPGSDMAKAIAYGTKRWPALSRFLEDGRLEIDNNIAERPLRGVAVGRRNWLFAGSRAGGERAAAIYTVIQTPAFAGAGSARRTASTRRPISPTLSPKSQATGLPAAGTTSCSGTGCRRQISQPRKPHNLRSPRRAYAEHAASGASESGGTAIRPPWTFDCVQAERRFLAALLVTLFYQAFPALVVQMQSSHPRSNGMDMAITMFIPRGDP
jgi:transposase